MPSTIEFDHAHRLVNVFGLDATHHEQLFIT
jgi:hypothetical protein